MSGRSAYVRAKNTERADKRLGRNCREFVIEDLSLYKYSRRNPFVKGFSSSATYVSSPPSSRRRHSLSSSGSTYPYPAPPAPTSGPIIVTSAIEKSDFRTHLDGMSTTLRGKLGRLLKGGDEHQHQHQRAPDVAHVGLEMNSRHDGTPSIDAVPSLSPSTSPDEASFPPAARQPPTPATRVRQHRDAVIHKIRRFEGGGKLPQLDWKSIASNPELWDDNGDTFVYMYMAGSRTKPPPSFRINSQVIKQSGSKTFIDKLFNTAEPPGWPRFYQNDDHSPRSTSSDERPNLFEGFPTQPSSSGPRSNASTDSLHPFKTSRKHNSKAHRGIRYEIYVAWPGAETGIHSTIWHITTRNFFAIMYDGSALVGATLYEAITFLFQRVSVNPDYLDQNISHVAWITDYMVRHKFDDVRNNPSYAASLLAFSELPGIQWREGYMEAFVHCVGMLNLGLQTIPEWRYITPHTKMFLQNASMEMEERIHRAQVWLHSFNFTEMWPTSSAPPSSARGCFDRLRKWLCNYYENAFLHWPPTSDQTWLTHDMVMRLGNDFSGLYDYLVDREAAFDGPQIGSGQKWIIVHQSNQTFRADTYELPLTDILVGFDDRHNFPHIPYPYPKTPKSTPVHNKPKSAFTLKRPTSPADIQAQSRRKALSYSEASNVYILRDQYVHTDLVTNFIKFEQNDQVDSLDPFEARRGRWLLIYGVLQVLATVSVDSPDLRYKEKCQYHLSPQMKGVVPWAETDSPAEEEAEHTRSHCWIAPSTWTIASPKVRHGSHKPILWGQYGDGRAHGDNAESILFARSRARGTNETGTHADNPGHGRKEAEEWVTGGDDHPDLRTDQQTADQQQPDHQVDQSQHDVQEKDGLPQDGLPGPDAAGTEVREGGVPGEEASDRSENYLIENSLAAARRRRTYDRQIPRGW